MKNLSPKNKTIILLTIITLILVILGFIISRFAGAITFLVFAIIIDVACYFFNDKIALYSANAKEASQKDAPEIYADLKEISGRLNMQTPKLYFSPTPQANAFSTGRDIRHSAICFTEGMFEQLTRAQIRAVMAHELAHIKHGDTLIGGVAALISSGVASIAQLGGDINSEEQTRNPIVTLLTIVFAPISSLILQVAVSREREFGADYASAKLTNAQDLIGALQNIDASVEVFEFDVNPGFSSLYILNPLKLRGLLASFGTHPSIEERIKRISTF